MLNNVVNANTYEVVDAAEWTQGDTLSVYFQLVDSSVDRAERGFSPAGRRYCPVASSTLTVQINSMDTAKSYTKTATQPFSLDASIWKIDIQATDLIQGTRDLLLVLTESAVVRRGRVPTAINVRAQIESY